MANTKKIKTPAKKDYEKTLVIPVERPMWVALKKISFETELSMSHLVRTGIQQIINDHKKMG